MRRTLIRSFSLRPSTVRKLRHLMRQRGQTASGMVDHLICQEYKQSQAPAASPPEVEVKS